MSYHEPKSMDFCNDLAMLLEVSLQLAESLDLKAVLQTAIEGAVSVLGLSSGAIYLLDDEEELALGATVPPLPAGHAHAGGTVPLAEHLHVGRALDTREALFVADIEVEALTPGERVAIAGRGLTSVLYVPIVARSIREAVLIVGSAEKHPGFNESELTMVRMLSTEIGYAISNARLHQAVISSARELRTAYDATLAGWSRALEMRDQNTGGHTDRAAAFAVELASRLGVPECALDDIRRGALLHDIGKMAVPDSILHKPGPLDEAEWAVMRKHPEFAYELLSGIGFLSSALEIPYCHHERWDGSGYPRGLAGEDIPLSARIFAVIDVYDALTSDRPYRSAWTREDALGHIAAQAGVHFDSEVVAVFLDHVAAEGYSVS